MSRPAPAAGETPSTPQEQARGRDGPPRRVSSRRLAGPLFRRGPAARRTRPRTPRITFLKLPRYVGDMEARPDLRLSIGPLELGAKPRVRLDYSAWEDGSLKGRVRSGPRLLGQRVDRQAEGAGGPLCLLRPREPAMGPVLPLLSLQPVLSGQRPPQPLPGGARHGFRPPRLDTGRRLTFSFIANTDRGRQQDDRSRRLPLLRASPSLRADLHAKGGLHGAGQLCLPDPVPEAGRREHRWAFTAAGPRRTRSCSTGKGRSPRAAAGSIRKRTASPPSARPWSRSTRTTPALYPALLVGGSYTFESKGHSPSNTLTTVRVTAEPTRRPTMTCAGKARRPSTRRRHDLRPGAGDPRRRRP